ncbi:flavin reductase [Dactylosporangium vinaceum]|uniref:Flavin reductase family protein n=1 Tax=Dactylosporangium vinaceum TaxID=53362 RepID=A0ABV5MS88_9ACTN|nr:flavin reductase family protein [Dactylosporangium vinaceum]UAC00206.1 flavin reductase [Dactylosporangium vinaceum]
MSTLVPVTGDALRCTARGVPTGVTIVTSGHGATLHGMTVNSFATLSLAPPLVAFSIREGCRLRSRLAAGAAFVVSVLADDQAELARRFADSSRPDGLDGVGTVALDEGGVTAGGAIAGAIGYFSCRTRSLTGVGDHTLVVGEVVGCGVLGNRPPLLFAGGRFHRLGPALC